MTSNITEEECVACIDTILNNVSINHLFCINEHWDLTVPSCWTKLPGNDMDIWDFRLHIVRSGKGTYVINNHKIPMSKGLLMFFSPPLNYGHEPDLLDPPSLISCHFDLYDGNSKQRLSSPVLPFFWTTQLNCGEYERILPFFSQISRLYCENRERKHQLGLRSSAIYQLLGFVQEICLITMDKNFDERVEIARLHMEKNPLTAKPFQVLAEEAGVGTDYFARLFNKQVGVSPKRYRLQCKMEYARFLLSLGKNVKQVAEQLKYSDPYVFSRLFKRIHGERPSSFKEK